MSLSCLFVYHVTMKKCRKTHKSLWLLFGGVLLGKPSKHFYGIICEQLMITMVLGKFEHLGLRSEGSREEGSHTLIVTCSSYIALIIIIIVITIIITIIIIITTIRICLTFPHCVCFDMVLLIACLRRSSS